MSQNIMKMIAECFRLAKKNISCNLFILKFRRTQSILFWMFLNKVRYWNANSIHIFKFRTPSQSFRQAADNLEEGRTPTIPPTTINNSYINSNIKLDEMFHDNSVLSHQLTPSTTRPMSNTSASAVALASRPNTE